MIKLSESQIASLLAKPETGMGYQTVDVRYRAETRRATVYNAELLLWQQEPQSILNAAYESLVRTARPFEAQFITSIEVVPPLTLLAERRIYAHAAPPTPGKPATESPLQKTEDADLFERFTAYLNDRRITPQKGLLPGTYATTEADAHNVRTGSEAVERYALPNPQPAIYRYTIAPHEHTTYRQGVVQPAHGHPGGGVEVIFPDGTHDNTVTRLTVLPP